jgi:hypothetical protein
MLRPLRESWMSRGHVWWRNGIPIDMRDELSVLQLAVLSNRNPQARDLMRTRMRRSVDGWTCRTDGRPPGALVTDCLHSLRRPCYDGGARTVTARVPCPPLNAARRLVRLLLVLRAGPLVKATRAARNDRDGMQSVLIHQRGFAWTGLSHAEMQSRA